MPSEKLEFSNPQGQQLVGRLELPEGPVRACAIFAHCFTCSKDVAAASRISKALSAKGLAVLRFDFTGLGNSDGDFANTNFSSNIDDLVAAAGHLNQHIGPARLLVGHSLGGAAVLHGAHRVPEATAVATIGAPSDPAHVSHLFGDHLQEIEAEGCALVNLAGREFRIKKQFLDDLEGHGADQHIRDLNRALVVFHSPVDELVSIDHAKSIYLEARHPKSFVSLDKADHLLTQRKDSEYVADVLAAWVTPYLD